MKLWSVVLVVVVAVLSALSSSTVLLPVQAQSGSLLASVDIHAAIGPVIAPNYIGFSLEHDLAMNWTGVYPNAPRPSLVNLMQQLMLTPNQPGPIYRIGGNSADYSWYNPQGLPFPNLPGPTWVYNITDVDILSLRDAVRAFNSSLIIGLNFRRGYNATWAIEHAAAIDRLIGYTDGTVLGLEIGNECDLYPQNGARPSNWSETDYESEWDYTSLALYEAIPSLPARIFQGAAGTFSYTNWIQQLPHYTKRFAGRMFQMAIHAYPLTDCNGNKPTLAQILAAEKASEFADAMVNTDGNVVADVNALGLPFTMGEGNSASCSGFNNMSNVFGVNLWAIDEMFHTAAVGIAGYVWHSHDSDPMHYPPLIWLSRTSDVPTVRALWYGLVFFAEATQNHAQIVSTNVTASSDSLVAWTTVDRAGIVRVTVLYKDLTATQPAKVTIDFTASHVQLGTGALERLTAPSPYAQTGITWAGVTWDGSQDGWPVGQRTSEPVPPTSGDGAIYTFSVAPISAVLLTFLPVQQQVQDIMIKASVVVK